jgi:hypothetical protein
VQSQSSGSESIRDSVYQADKRVEIAEGPVKLLLDVKWQTFECPVDVPAILLTRTPFC